MNKEIARKWVDALRSGKYKQTTGRLRYEDAYCCLGVLCDLAVEAGVGQWQRERIAGIGFASNGNFTPGYPATPVQTWAALEDRYGHDLAYANDTGATFAEIASMIEKEAGLVT